MDVVVGYKHIERAKQERDRSGNVLLCPIFYALKDRHHQLGIYPRIIFVTYAGIIVDSDRYRISKRALRWLFSYDSRKEVKPAKFRFKKAPEILTDINFDGTRELVEKEL